LTPEINHLLQPVLAVARKDVAKLREDFTVQQALDAIRQRGVGEKIVYFSRDGYGRLAERCPADPKAVDRCA
jgi:hypothetical protein